MRVDDQSLEELGRRKIAEPLRGKSQIFEAFHIFDFFANLQPYLLRKFHIVVKLSVEYHILVLLVRIRLSSGVSLEILNVSSYRHPPKPR